MYNSDSRLLRTLSNQYHMDFDYLENISKIIGMQDLQTILGMKKQDLNYTIRFNLFRSESSEIVNKLKSEGIHVKHLSIVPEGYIVTQGTKKIGHSLSYLTGEIMPQGYGSMLSVHLLDPKPGETVLDLSAAPGGKTCFIGERMKNNGIIVANEYSHSRIKSLVDNLSRHGINNILLTIKEGSKLKTPFLFDKVLLDAPCSGDGLIVSQPELKSKKSLQTSYLMQKTQIALLKNAVSLLKPGGVGVYSTCAMNSVENEEVLLPFLSKIELLETLNFGTTGFTEIAEEFKHTIRILPSEYSCDGFYIAKFKKI